MMTAKEVSDMLDVSPGLTIITRQSRTSHPIDDSELDNFGCYKDDDYDWDIDDDSSSDYSDPDPLNEQGHENKDNGDCYSNDGDGNSNDDDGVSTQRSECQNHGNPLLDGGEASSESTATMDHEQAELTRSEDLLCLLRLYTMADTFGIAPLKLLARNHLFREVEARWSMCEDIPGFVDELYSTTPPTETVLRGLVARLVSLSIDKEGLLEKLEPVARKHGDFAADILRYRFLPEADWWKEYGSC